MANQLAKNEVAVISDDAEHRHKLAGILEQLEFKPLEFGSIDALCISNNTPSAVVLAGDVLSSSILEQIGRLNFISSIVLISNTDEENNVVTALYNGAHFFFDITDSDSLLACRLQAALNAPANRVLTNIVAQPYTFDVRRRRAYMDDKYIKLSPMEYSFAEYLFSRPEKIVAKSELLLSVWSLPRVMDARRVDTAACRIRKKMQLGSHQSGWELIYIRRGGFKLAQMNSSFEYAPT